MCHPAIIKKLPDPRLLFWLFLRRLNFVDDGRASIDSLRVTLASFLIPYVYDVCGYLSSIKAVPDGDGGRGGGVVGLDNV